MKASKRKQDRLTRLSSNRIANRTQSLSSSSAKSLYGPRKDVLVTYSKSKPINVLRKQHFQSPDTPHVSTPDSLQATIKDQEFVKDDSVSIKKITSHMQYSSASLGKSQLSLSNPKPLTPGHPKVKPSLALRNITNIPIDKTLSRTQCTPRQEDNKNPISRTSSRSKSSTIRLTQSRSNAKDSQSGKHRKHLNLEFLQLVEKAESGSLGKKSKKSAKRPEHLTQDSTNYSVKAMSTDMSNMAGKSRINQSKTQTSPQTMSICSTIVEVNDQDIDTPIIENQNTSMQYNSTMNEDVDNVQLKDYFDEPLSPIIESDEMVENYNDKSIKDDKLAVMTKDSSKRIENNNTAQEKVAKDQEPKTSTPVDGEKISKPSGLDEDKESPHEVSTNNKDINQSKSQTEPKKETSKNKSLQSSKYIENDNDNDVFIDEDNVTPELIPPKIQCSSSKRKLEYSVELPIKQSTRPCILEDFPCTVRQSYKYKVWIKIT